MIVEKADINKNDNVIEIGPGTGNLTKRIIFKTPRSITVIEKDQNLSNKLKVDFKDKIKLINKDFLLMKEKDIKLNDNIILGNLPYNVSTEILIKLIKTYKNAKYKKLLLCFKKKLPIELQPIIIQKLWKIINYLTVCYECLQNQRCGS